MHPLTYVSISSLTGLGDDPARRLPRHLHTPQALTGLEMQQECEAAFMQWESGPLPLLCLRPAQVAHCIRLQDAPYHRVLTRGHPEGVSALRASDPPMDRISPGEIETCHFWHCFCSESRFQGANVPN